MGYRGLAAMLVLAGAMLVMDCAQTPTELGPLQYKQRYAGNVSEIFAESPTGRKSKTDGYAPDFTWRNSSGQFDSLSGQQGKVVLLNFWASWCGPCKNEMPDLESIHKTYGDSVVVIGVSVDYPGDAFNTVKEFVNGSGYSYQMVVDSAFTLFAKYMLDPLSPIPQSFIIDPDGNARFAFTGQQSKQTFLTWIRKAQ